MRLDKYLKVSRLIKRRTIAKEACENERVFVNDKAAKPGTEIKAGDILEIRFGDRSVKAEILSLTEHVKKDEAKEMFKILD